MNFIFHSPFLLFGLTAAILPILIHRITRKRAVIRKFSAVRLLLQSQLITARPQRLKHLLLLALRMLSVAMIVAMMARPVIVRPGFAALSSGGARLLILDNSMSMGFQEERGRRFEVAKRAAKEILNGFEGRVAVIPTVDSTDPRNKRWMKAEEALQHLETIPLSYGGGNMAAAFAGANQQLNDLKVPKQIFVLSDMMRNDWEGFNVTRNNIVSDTEVTFFRIGDTDRDPNFCVKTVGLTQGELVAGLSSPLEVTVSNLSSADSTMLVHLYLSGKKTEQKSIEVKSGADGSVYFSLMIPKSGWVDGEIRLAADRLPADDIYYFSLKVNEKIRALVVDGDPTTSLKESESYYLVNALRPGDREGSPFLTNVIVESELNRTDYQLYDVLFVLNSASPDFGHLASFLEMGRPVFIFLGDRIVPERYNRFALAPWQIRGRMNVSADSREAFKIGSIGESLKFLTPMHPQLKHAAFRTYYKVDGSTGNLLTLKNGDPLFVAAEAGKSRLYLFASSADVDWNDLPLKAVYLPFIYGTVKESVGLWGNSLPGGLTLGDPLAREGVVAQLKGAAGGPGIYRFLRSDGELRRGVNTPAAESDLVKLSKTDLERKFGSMDVQIMEYKEKSLKDLQGGRKELWPALLVLLLAVLAVEMLLANGILSFKKGL